jgi:iron complex outermembrane receptor protein
MFVHLGEGTMQSKKPYSAVKSILAVSLCASALLGAGAGSAAAQQTGGGAHVSAPADAMGEIVVTARKRQETILNVPVVATAIPQVQMERVQVLDLKDVSKFVPGLTFAQTLGISGLQVSLRGVGTSATNVGIDASVALNIDGMQITQAIAYTSGMFDLGQIEVLKGPQALFFGKNSPGGVISLRSADPTDKFEMITRYGYEFEALEHQASVILSGPVSDTLKLRLATQYDTSDGYFKNRAVAAPNFGGMNPLSSRSGGDESWIVRGTAIWEPNDKFKARLKLNASRDKQTGGVGLKVTSCPDGQGAVPPRTVPFMNGEDCKLSRNVYQVDLDPRYWPTLIDKTGLSYNLTKQEYGTLEMNWKPWDDITVTSVTGFYHLWFQSQQALTSSYSAAGFASFVDPVRRRDITEEVRVNSDFTGPLNFTAGGFYQDGKLSNLNELPGNTAIGQPARLQRYQHFVGIQSASAFGQLRYKIIPTLELAGGARYTHEQRDINSYNLISGTAVFYPQRTPKIHSNNVSPEATLTWKPTDDMTAFASYKKGFKSGSFQLTGLAGVLPENSFGDERVEGFEVGMKSQWLERRLYTEIAYYNYLYQGLQVGANAVDPITGIPASRTRNAGDARVYGIDFSASYLPEAIDGLHLNTSILWNHARFKTFNGIPCWGGQRIVDGCNQVFNPVTGLYTAQSMTGQTLQRAPTWQINFGFDYDFQVGNDMTLTLTNANQYSSKYRTVLGVGRDDYFQKAYIKSDLSLTLKGPNDKWETALIGKNIGDKITTGGCTNSGVQNGLVAVAPISGGNTRNAAGVDEVSCYLNRGREVWLRVTYRPFD